jgi:hypothetical protein
MTLRIILSWGCYWTGDAVSRTVEPIFGRWFEWPYVIYSRLMLWSDSLQGDDPRGPWGPVSARDGEDVNGGSNG